MTRNTETLQRTKYNNTHKHYAVKLYYIHRYYIVRHYWLNMSSLEKILPKFTTETPFKTSKGKV